jgi:hypothetical protein
MNKPLIQKFKIQLAEVYGTFAARSRMREGTKTSWRKTCGAKKHQNRDERASKRSGSVLLIDPEPGKCGRLVWAKIRGDLERNTHIISIEAQNKD